MISNLTRKITIPHKCCYCPPVAVLPGRGRLLPCVPGGGGGGGGQRGEGGGELLQPGAVQLRQQRRDGAARPARGHDDEEDHGDVDTDLELVSLAGAVAGVARGPLLLVFRLRWQRQVGDLLSIQFQRI